MNSTRTKGFWDQDGLATAFGILTWIVYGISVGIGVSFFGLVITKLMVALIILGGFIFSFMWLFINMFIIGLLCSIHRCRYNRWKKKEDMNIWIRSCRK